MYQASSHFILAGLSQEWVIALQNTAPPDHFSHTYEIATVLPEVIAPNTTAILFSDSAMADDLLRQAAGNARLILCTEAPACLNQIALTVLDDIWPATVTAEVARFYFSRLLQEIKAEKDAWLDRLYLATAVNNESDLIWLKDTDGAYLRVNTAFCRVADKTRDNIIGRCYEDLWGPAGPESDNEDADSQLSSDDPLPTGIADMTEESIASPSGLLRIQTVKFPLHDDDGMVIGTVGIGRDVTQLRKYECRLRRAANTDELTKLKNRRSFFEHIMKNRGDRPLTLGRLKLSHLKHLNDTYGSQKGDEALVAMAGFLRVTFPDAILCRFGGGEFLIGQLGVDASDDFKAKFADMLGNIQQCCDSEKHPLLLSANLGITVASDSAVSLDKLIRQSDLALYYSHNLGDGQCCVFSEIISE